MSLKGIYALIFISAVLQGVVCDPEYECIEVGHARTSHAFFDAYHGLKDGILALWAQEDSTKDPRYTAFDGILKNTTRAAVLLEEVSKELLKGLRKTRVGRRCRSDWLLKGIEKHVMPVVNLDKQLSDDLGLVQSFQCLVNSPYPNVDGTCVSLGSPDLGANGAKFLRLMSAHPAADGFSLRSSTKDGKQLPSARAVANVLRKHIKKPDVSHLFALWSHFLQQDIFSIPESPYTEGVDCCAKPDSEDCAPIPVPESDPMADKMKCINFKRSAPAQAILGHREEMSLITTYIDATPLYGPTNEIAFTKKTNFFGLLKGPEKKEEMDGKCKVHQSLDGCFNKDPEHGYAPGIRTLFMLEHNRLADALAELNPSFDDSLLYNEARRILIAEYAAITYGSFLPSLLSNATAEKHFLLPSATGPAANYVKEVNPGVLTSYATAAFRNPSMLTEWSKEAGARQELFNSAHYGSVVDEPYQDLLAMDIQRGRDHGLASYQTWKRFSDNGFVIDKFDDLESLFSKEAVEDLREVYGGVLEDVDMMVALLEPPENGAIAGKTFSYISADQFARLRTGNRLYWQHEEYQFNTEQTAAIMEFSLAALICANLPVQQVPKDPFFPVSDKNPLIECSDVKPLDLKHWVANVPADTAVKEDSDSKPKVDKILDKIKQETDAKEEEKAKDSSPEKDKEKKEEESEASEQTKTPEQSMSSSSSSGSKVSAAAIVDGNPTVGMESQKKVDSKPVVTTRLKEDL